MATPSASVAPGRIRHATEGDAGELARLRWQCTREAAEAAEGAESLEAFTDRFRDFVRRALVSGRWSIWVAELDGRLVGNIWVHLIDRVPRPYGDTAVWGYVTNVYVEPEVRNRGLGGMLLDAGVEWGRYVGADRLIVWPRGGSNSLYERHGFGRTAEAMELRFRELGQPLPENG